MKIQPKTNVKIEKTTYSLYLQLYSMNIYLIHYKWHAAYEQRKWKRLNENSREQIICIPLNCTVFKRKYVQYKYYMFAKYCRNYIICIYSFNNIATLHIILKIPTIDNSIIISEYSIQIATIQKIATIPKTCKVSIKQKFSC